MSLKDDDLISEFVVESNEHLADVENQFLQIEAAGSNIDVDLVNRVFRAIHSIKGAAGFLGLKVINSLAHRLENVLNLVRNQQLTPTPAIVEVMLRAADELRRLINDIHNSNSADVSEFGSQLDAIANQQAPVVASPPSTPKVVAAAPPVVAECPPPAVEPTPVTVESVSGTAGFASSLAESSIDQSGVEASAESTVMEATEEPFAAEASPVVDGFESGDSVAVPHQIPDCGPQADAQAPVFEPAMRSVSSSCPPQEPERSMNADHSVSPEPSPVPASDVNANLAATNAPRAETAAAVPADTNIRVSVNVLDRLMNLAGELVLSRNQLIQAIGSPNKTNLDSVAAGVDRVTSELQEAIMCTRMQPIGNVFSRFPRVLRDLAAKLGKQCELVIEGKEVEVDKTIVEAIGDPLTHLVRNSVDHGIERPDVRQAAGKPKAGKILMQACYQAGKVKIVIVDDGAGINPKTLKEKAVAKGIISAQQAATMGDREAIRLIFHPGFSTAEKISDVSGRGVGMDVVRTNIERLGGTVDVESVVGKGTTIHITLPLTLAIIPSMIVKCRQQRYAIPQVNILELVRVRSDERAKRIGHLKDVEVLRLRGSLLPLVRLDRALSIPVDENATGEVHGREDATHVVVVETGQARYGLVVDGVHDSEEIVVKALGRHLKGCSCLAGATILGDGYVALILDVVGVAHHVKLRLTENSQTTVVDNEEKATREEERQTLLLFSSDPSEQFAVPMTVVSRIERVKAQQIVNVAGQELLQHANSAIPLINVHDHIRALPRPELDRYFVVIFQAAGREIGLVASRLNDIREVPMNLDNATFRTKGVLGSIVIESNTTRVLNLFELAEARNPEWFEDREKATQEIVKDTCTILVAEDSAFFRRQLTAMLERQGYSVVGAEDGQQAFEILCNPDNHFDLVLSDVEMPNMNGLQLCQRIKTSPALQHLPVLMLSSLAGDEDIQRGKGAGADDYQVKLDQDALLSGVARLLTTRNTRLASNNKTSSRGKRDFAKV